MKSRLVLLAGLLGLTGVLAGTFGAHGLDILLPESLDAAEAVQRHEWVETAVRYHLWHALAILALAALAPVRPGRTVLAAVLFTIGIALFSGALYALAVTGWRWLGMVAPIGGMSLMAGWVFVMLLAGRVRD